MADDIKILDHLNIDLDGDGIVERYEISGMSKLPVASTEVLGGVKVGENLIITEDGTLNAEASGTSVLSPGAVIYDEQERIVGRWSDGRPVYQKTIIYEGESVSTTTSYNHNINNLDKVVNANVIAKRTGSDNIRETYNISDNNEVARFVIKNTTIDITFKWDPYNILLITLQYTKTTDELNSFRPDMIENISIMRNLDFSNIYTEEERIIGCWVDGRPIYQKYIDIGDISGSELNNYDVSSLNINFLVYADVNYYQTNVNNTELWYSASSGADSRVLGISSDHTKLLCWGTNSVFRYTKLILRYTKTTDAENSFTADMLTDYENITNAEIEAAAAADKI